MSSHFQPGANLYGIAVDVRVPTTLDVVYPTGKWWLFVGNSLWYLLNKSTIAGQLTANWVEVVGASGAITSVVETTNQITVSPPVGGVVTLSIPTTFIAPGTIAATGTVTASGFVATTGNYTATLGNLVLSGAGSKVDISAATPATASVGTATLAGGTIVVATTAVTASSLIFVSRNTAAGTTGELSAPEASIVAGTSFTIDSTSGTDTSTVNYWIIN